LKAAFTKALRINPELFDQWLNFYCSNNSDRQDIDSSEFIDLYHFSKDHYNHTINALKQRSRISVERFHSRRLSILAKLVKDLVTFGLGCNYTEFLFKFLNFERPAKISSRKSGINRSGRVADILVNGLSKLFGIPPDDANLRDIAVERFDCRSTAFTSFKGPLMLLSVYFDLFVTKNGYIKSIERLLPEGDFPIERLGDYSSENSSEGDFPIERLENSLKIIRDIQQDEFVAYLDESMYQIGENNLFAL
jgi:hypothetical protein